MDWKNALTSFRPVVTRTTLTKDEVVGTEEIAQRTRSNRVHGSRFEVDQDRTRNVLVCTNFVVVDIDTFKLKVVGTLVQSIAINAVFVRDDLPEFGTWRTRGRSDRKLENEMKESHQFGYRTIDQCQLSIQKIVWKKTSDSIPGQFGGGRFHAFCWTTISKTAVGNSRLKMRRYDSRDFAHRARR